MNDARVVCDKCGAMAPMAENGANGDQTVPDFWATIRFTVNIKGCHLRENYKLKHYIKDRVAESLPPAHICPDCNGYTEFQQTAEELKVKKAQEHVQSLTAQTKRVIKAEPAEQSAQ